MVKDNGVNESEWLKTMELMKVNVKDNGVNESEWLKTMELMKANG